MSSIQIHTIKGRKYPYRHTYINGKVVCTLIKGTKPDGRKARTESFKAATRLANSPYAHHSYDSQEDLDAAIRTAYRAGYGVTRIQKVFAEIDLYPTRRQTENYLRDIGIELRIRTEKKQKTPLEIHNIKQEEYEAAQKYIIDQEIAEKLRISENEGKKMKKMAAQDAKEILRLRQQLMNFRDMGRSPTAEEIEQIIIDSK